MPMRTKLVCRSAHSRLRFGAEGEIGDEAIEKGVCHKIDRQTSARNEWIKMAFSIDSFIPSDMLMVPQCGTHRLLVARVQLWGSQSQCFGIEFEFG